MFNSVCMVGLGYIGLPTATILASKKIKVIGVDINQKVVDTINQGRIHIVEPELDVLVHAVVSAGYLRAATIPEPADAFLIAVPTPFAADHKPDVSYIRAAANSIAPVLQKGNLVILESTSPVGTTELLAAWLAELRPDLKFPLKPQDSSDIHIAYCPERVLPGRVVHELVENDRIIGGLNQTASALATSLYETFVSGALIATDSRTAEMCKLTENSYRDVNIAFANELSIICDRLNIDVWELIALANRHPRVDILRPGPGVGGHCIAVDPWFIVDSAADQARIIKAAREINDSKPDWVIQRVDSFAAARPRSRQGGFAVACLGLSFKPDIDDLRESPALAIATKLSARGYAVAAVEPNLPELEHHAVPANIELLSLDDALDKADLTIVLVKHKEFVTARDRIRSKTPLLDVVGLYHE